jgi:hypothetical protein
MWTFQTGDLVAKIHPVIPEPLQVGLVISHDENTFLIKWISFNKSFFMEKEEDIFRELNNSFLLDTVQVHRMNMEANLSLLNSNYSNDKKDNKAQERKSGDFKKNS